MYFIDVEKKKGRNNQNHRIRVDMFWSKVYFANIYYVALIIASF
jgi:hypothetical protein